jgi:hypothetical protein
VKPFNLVYSETATEALLALSAARASPLLYDLRKLAEDPSIRSDYTIEDENGRPLENLLIGEFVIAYWLDHPVQELRIVQITDVS